jgi:bifunctional non-homologous end joining protein LigD
VPGLWARERIHSKEEDRHIVNLRFSKPIECLSAKKLPTGKHWTYEIKLDGFRVEAARTENRVTLYSKQGKLLTSQFMQIALGLE